MLNPATQLSVEPVFDNELVFGPDCGLNHKQQAAEDQALEDYLAKLESGEMRVSTALRLSLPQT